MRFPGAAWVVLAVSTAVAQTPGKSDAVSACSTELGRSTLTIYVPLTGDVQLAGRPVPEVRLGIMVMRLIDTADFKTILLLVAPDATYARARNAVDQALEGSRGLPVAAVQLRADEDN